ncbi:MAG: chorismate-binding protein [Aquificota bacterium]|nr:chorismate-binding protein [Aquificota bacterium]
MSVLIRTAFGGGPEISYFSGCGIVFGDSEPEREWEELLLKQKAFYP